MDTDWLHKFTLGRKKIHIAFVSGNDESGNGSEENPFRTQNRANQEALRYTRPNLAIQFLFKRGEFPNEEPLLMPCIHHCIVSLYGDLGDGALNRFPAVDGRNLKINYDAPGWQAAMQHFEKAYSLADEPILIAAK